MQSIETLLKACVVGALSSVIQTVPAAAYPIAGVEPWHRPAGAPVIREFQKDHAWFQRALYGISQPYPASLHFLENQGAWYTPFDHPGMHGPYDIRGWYSH